MLKYVVELKQRYEEGKLSKVEYLQELLSKFCEKAVGKPGHQIRGAKALLVLTKEKTLGSAITQKEIQEQAQFPPNYSHCGMWGLVQGGIVEKLKAPERYRIRPEFYKVIEEILSRRGW